MRILLLLTLALSAAAQPLENRIRERISTFPGSVSLYAKNLDTGATFGIREAEPTRTASTIKFPIMIAVFDGVARGKAKWTEPLTLTAAEKVSGSGILGNEISDGVQLPLRDVMHLMIVVSDNTATNMILERFTADAVNAYLDKIGIRTTRALRKVRGDGKQLKTAAGWSAAGKLPENEKYGLGVSSPREMVTLLDRLERGELVSAEASAEMVAVLKRCQGDTGIRRRFPGVPIANKTGALDTFRADVGIVYSKNGRIAMAIAVEGIPKVDYGPDNLGAILIGDLAAILVDGLAKP